MSEPTTRPEVTEQERHAKLVQYLVMAHYMHYTGANPFATCPHPPQSEEPLVDEWGDFAKPDTINLHDPLNVVMLLDYENITLLHRRLVCWCLVQRYRYYVLSQPLVSDGEYDAVEKYLTLLESESDQLRQANPFSPVIKVGSNRMDDYPNSIRCWFPYDKFPPDRSKAENLPMTWLDAKGRARS